MGMEDNPQAPVDGGLGLENAAAAVSDTWWVWTLLTPILLVAGVWYIWRTRLAGPDAFNPDLPPVVYDRLHRWAARLGLATPENHTPYEQARALTQTLPEGPRPHHRHHRTLCALPFQSACVGPGYDDPRPRKRRVAGKLAGAPTIGLATLAAQAPGPLGARSPRRPLPPDARRIGRTGQAAC